MSNNDPVNGSDPEAREWQAIPVS